MTGQFYAHTIIEHKPMLTTTNTARYTLFSTLTQVRRVPIIFMASKRIIKLNEGGTSVADGVQT